MLKFTWYQSLGGQDSSPPQISNWITLFFFNVESSCELDNKARAVSVLIQQLEITSQISSRSWWRSCRCRDLGRVRFDPLEIACQKERFSSDWHNPRRSDPPLSLFIKKKTPPCRRRVASSHPPPCSENFRIAIARGRGERSSCRSEPYCHWICIGVAVAWSWGATLSASYHKQTCRGCALQFWINWLL